MAAYILLGKYSLEGLKAASAQRTKKATGLIEKIGGKVVDMYAVIGEYDLVVYAQFPDNLTALQGSVGLTTLTGISFLTLPAIPVAEFDTLISK